MAEKNLYLSKDMGGIPEDQVCFGYVSGVFGIRGELRIFLHNPESRFFLYAQDVFFIHYKKFCK
jgi:ribosomal 30S subunit maturation factor RimM